jgi:hypothetical protein
MTTARKPSSSPLASSVSRMSTSRTWQSSGRSSSVGKTLFTTVSDTDRYVPVATSLGPVSVTPGVTHCAIGVSPDSVPSPSAMTTSASHGVSSWPNLGARSQGSVRRLRTT